MKNHLLLLSMIAVLSITACTKNAQTSSLVNEVPPQSTEDPFSEEQGVKNDNFTIEEPTDVSSMSSNCKQYVDDMRAQQKRLLEEKGQDADYYLNDLFGDDGVDITKGVLPSTGNYQDNTGGYRDTSIENDYLDPIGADYTKGEKSSACCWIR